MGFECLSGNSYALELIRSEHFAAAKPFALEQHRLAQRLLGEREETRIQAAHVYSFVLWIDPTASRANVLEAEALLVNIIKTMQVAYGPENPYTVRAASDLEKVREILADSSTEFPH